MKVLVVGGSGFIGSHVVDELIIRNFSVMNIDLIEYTPANIENYKFVRCSMLDYALLSNIIVEYKPDVVYNFAAIAGIEQCQNNPLDAIRKNVMGHTYVLQGVVDYISWQSEISKYLTNKPLVIFASSVYVYNEKSGFYGATKNACEVFTRCYANRYGFPFVLLRYGTVYGQRAGKGNSIHNILNDAIETKKISYYGTGEEVREYIHVKDAARFSVDIIEDESCHDMPVVISSLYPIKSADMIKMIKDILGQEYSTEFRGEKTLDHYEVTPYTYVPDIAVKYIGNKYYDLGAGLLDLIRKMKKDV